MCDVDSKPGVIEENMEVDGVPEPIVDGTGRTHNRTPSTEVECNHGDACGDSQNYIISLAGPPDQGR